MVARAVRATSFARRSAFIDTVAVDLNYESVGVWRSSSSSSGPFSASPWRAAREPARRVPAGARRDRRV